MHGFREWPNEKCNWEGICSVSGGCDPKQDRGVRIPILPVSIQWEDYPVAPPSPISWSRKAHMDSRSSHYWLWHCGWESALLVANCHILLTWKGWEETGDGKTLRALAGTSFPPQQVSNCGTRLGLLSDPSAVSAGGRREANSAKARKGAAPFLTCAVLASLHHYQSLNDTVSPYNLHV